MTTVAFDTHKFVTELTNAGMPEELALVLSNHYSQTLNDRLATKEDLEKMATKEDIKGIQADMKDMWIKFLVSQLAIAGFIIVALSYLRNF